MRVKNVEYFIEEEKKDIIEKLKFIESNEKELLLLFKEIVKNIKDRFESNNIM
ncbi:TPA: hypothetical protein KSL09_003209 [Clostridioides difficile]|nr:hypothetical protein [Clostridioides difficile]